MSARFLTSLHAAPVVVNSVVPNTPTTALYHVNPKMFNGSHAIVQPHGQNMILGKIMSTEPGDGVIMSDVITFPPEGIALHHHHHHNHHQHSTQPVSSLYPIQTQQQQMDSQQDHGSYAVNGGGATPMSYHDYTPEIYASSLQDSGYYQTAVNQFRDAASDPTLASNQHSHTLPSPPPESLIGVPTPNHLGPPPSTPAPLTNGTTDGSQSSPTTTSTTLAAAAAAVGMLPSLAGHHLVTHQGNTYLVPVTTTLNHETAAALFHGGGSGSMAHSTRASPVTVQWLIENYETADGVSLPRSTLYNHYLRHCHEHKLESMNPASFGKLIRSVFLGLRTRRLGTRGNSKYHYYGIRIKPNSHLIQLSEEQNIELRHCPHYSKNSAQKHFGIGRLKSGVRKVESLVSSGSYHTSDTSTPGDTSSSGCGGTFGLDPGQPVSKEESTVTVPTSVAGRSASALHQQFLGDAGAALSNLADICCAVGLGHVLQFPSTRLSFSSEDPNEITDTDTAVFVRLYSEHCEDILNSVVNLNFTLIESLWENFWRTGQVENSHLEHQLPRSKLILLSQRDTIQRFVRLADHTFYQSLVDVLIPDVLRPIPQTLTQGVRTFAKSLEGWIRSALHGLDSRIITVKLSGVTALAQTLRRYTSLNHLAQAARAVLHNTDQISQMLTDLSRVDFANVQEQASWVCQCPQEVITQLESDFKRLLQQQLSLEQWAAWLEQIVDRILAPYAGRRDYPTIARHFILKWSFYSSLVIRDLTLRSASSFGSFHLIRLLYDEYIYYLIEHKVAAHLGLTAVAVIGDLGKELCPPDVTDLPASLATILSCDLRQQQAQHHAASSATNVSDAGISTVACVPGSQQAGMLSSSSMRRSEYGFADSTATDEEDDDEHHHLGSNHQQVNAAIFRPPSCGSNSGHYKQQHSAQGHNQQLMTSASSSIDGGDNHVTSLTGLVRYSTKSSPTTTTVTVGSGENDRDTTYSLIVRKSVRVTTGDAEDNLLCPPTSSTMTTPASLLLMTGDDVGSGFGITPTSHDDLLL